MDPVELAVWALGITLLLLVARGTYVIWRATRDQKAAVRARVAQKEGRRYEDRDREFRKTLSEADGRLYLYKKRLKDFLSRGRSE